MNSLPFRYLGEHFMYAEAVPDWFYHTVNLWWPAFVTKLVRGQLGLNKLFSHLSPFTFSAHDMLLLKYNMAFLSKLYETVTHFNHISSHLSTLDVPFS